MAIFSCICSYMIKSCVLREYSDFNFFRRDLGMGLLLTFIFHSFGNITKVASSKSKSSKLTPYRRLGSWKKSEKELVSILKAFLGLASQAFGKSVLENPFYAHKCHLQPYGYKFNFFLDIHIVPLQLYLVCQLLNSFIASALQ